MRLSVMFKSVAVLIGCVLIAALGIFFTSRHFMYDGFEKSMHNQLTTMRSVVDTNVNVIRSRLLQEAKLLSSYQAVRNAFVSRDAAALKAFARKSMQQCEADFVILVDETGRVVARGHMDKTGDSFSEFKVVQRALKGMPSVDVERLHNSGLSFASAGPVLDNGKVVGVILLGNAFSTHALVDSVKAATHFEMTIFDRDTRISTTIMNRGQRAVGTRLDNATVQQAVLQNRGVYAAPATILGVSYRTIYWPILDSDKNVQGMWFIGLEVRLFEEMVSNIAYSCLIATIIIVVVLSLFGFLFFRSLVKPLVHAVQYAGDVSNGNLQAELSIPARRDEVGDLVEALRRMVGSLRQKISEADRAAGLAEEKSRQAEEATREAEEAAEAAHTARRDGMHAAAEKLEAVVVALSTAASQLSAQIEESDRGAKASSERLAEAATAMNEMNATVQEVASNASSAANMSSRTRQDAEEGQKILTNAMNSINYVQKVSLELQSDMGRLHEHTQDISQIMSVISDIADQTNLLALNAAIEAARAGDAGRGFAVVADEVRKLAEKTMASTKDVGNAITSIQNSAQQSVDKMSEALNAVEQATSLANESGAALQHIVQNVEETADQVRAIAAAAEEQSAASEEINQSVVIVNEMSGQTAQAMDEAAKAISELAQQTESLAALVRQMEQE